MQDTSQRHTQSKLSWSIPKHSISVGLLQTELELSAEWPHVYLRTNNCFVASDRTAQVPDQEPDACQLRNTTIREQCGSISLLHLPLCLFLQLPCLTLFPPFLFLLQNFSILFMKWTGIRLFGIQWPAFLRYFSHLLMLSNGCPFRRCYKGYVYVDKQKKAREKSLFPKSTDSFGLVSLLLRAHSSWWVMFTLPWRWLSTS